MDLALEERKKLDGVNGLTVCSCFGHTFAIYMEKYSNQPKWLVSNMGQQSCEGMDIPFMIAR